MEKHRVCECGFTIGDTVITSHDALIPNSEGQIVGLADDDCPESADYFIVDFGDSIGTCTVQKVAMTRLAKVLEQGGNEA